MKNRIGMFLTLPLLAVLAITSCNKQPSPANNSAAKTETKGEEGEWCAEHGVPESICTRCHPNLIAAFKQKGDWCKEHNLPESQCIQCDPTLKEKFQAMAPKS